MKLSKTVLFLWGGRLTSLNFAILLIPETESNMQIYRYAVLIAFDLTVGFVLFLRYRYCRIYFFENHIHIKSGIIIRKEQTVRRSQICAVKLLCDPLSAAMGLANPVLHCEGVKLFLPPLTKSQQILLTQYKKENSIET